MKPIDSTELFASKKSASGVISVAAFLMLFIASPAQAYLDPSTGSLIIQIILGGIAGILVAGKLYWARVKEFFGFSTGDAVDGVDAVDAVREKDTADPDAD